VREHVMDLPLFDTHEHVMSIPEFSRARPRFSSLAEYAEADLVRATRSSIRPPRSRPHGL
jgi:hypothetical protein